MDNPKQAMVEQLNSQQLPVLPAETPALLEALSNDTLDSSQLSVVIERFPTIAGRLLALANSAWSSPIQPIYSLDMACGRLGFSIVRSTSIALAVGSPFTPSLCPLFEVPRFWCRSLVVADIAAHLSEICGEQEHIEMARASGLLHNLGLLWLVDQIPESIQETIQIQQQETEDEKEPFGDILKQKIGFDYCDAGGFLAEEWGLPEPFVHAMELHRNPDLYIETGIHSSIIGHSVAIAQALEQEDPSIIPDTITSSLGINHEDTMSVYKSFLPKLKRHRTLAETIF